VTVRRNHERNGIEVVFSGKPDGETRANLKDLSFRWSRRQGLWYRRYSDYAWQEVHKVLGQ